MFEFFRRNRPAFFRTDSVEAVEKIIESAEAQGKHVVLDISNLDLDELNVFDVEENGRKKTGRNDPCPCGSGLKYKKCCLAH